MAPQLSPNKSWEGAVATALELAEPLAGRVVVSMVNALARVGKEFQAIVQALASGDDTAANDLRALSVLADRGGERLTSRASGILYGFSSHSLG